MEFSHITENSHITLWLPVLKQTPKTSACTGPRKLSRNQLKNETARPTTQQQNQTILTAQNIAQTSLLPIAVCL